MGDGFCPSLIYWLIGLLLLAMNIICCTCALALFIQTGDLVDVRTTEALNFMNGATMDKSKWWKLSNTTSHPEAFLRFMVLGAPQHKVFPNASWGMQEREEFKKKGFLLATRNASLADFTSQQSIPQLGNLHITAWMLGFSCIDSPLCENSVAPMVIVYRTAVQCLEFTTVWNKLAIRAVTNTIPAKLINVIKNDEQQTTVQKGDTLNVKVSTMMESCGNISFNGVGSSLDATYNLGPYACYQMDAKFKNFTSTDLLLVLGMQSSADVSTSEADFNPVGRRNAYDPDSHFSSSSSELSEGST